MMCFPPSRTRRLFQFTRPRGARPPAAQVPAVRGGFQFTRPRGARQPKGSSMNKILVSIHAPTGGATGVKHRLERLAPVSIHAPTGGATAEAQLAAAQASFNSRAHGGRDSHRRVGVFLFPFQFTRPRGARHPRADGRRRPRCFNSRAHGGRDKERDHALRLPEVSIHAPTGGATAGNSAPKIRPKCQFTRPRGARQKDRSAGIIHKRFQFTRPRGARQTPLQTLTGCSQFQFTRPRGARHAQQQCSPPDRSFNSRAHGGRDRTIPPARFRPDTFQFTRPRGARRGRRTRARCPWRCFNSRAHGGRDGVGSLPELLIFVSIHAPTGGATSATSLGRWAIGCFNSRAHGGRDRGEGGQDHLDRRFNSRAHGGRDAEMEPAARGGGVSIHAPTGGATRPGTATTGAG